jgi:hypothetical protein
MRRLKIRTLSLPTTAPPAIMTHWLVSVFAAGPDRLGTELKLIDLIP